MNLTPKHCRSAPGLTLLELVIVLAILAALAGIATTTTRGLFEQNRHETNQRSLTEIEHAVLGDASIRQPDGSRVPHGFVADLGRLPRAFNDGGILTLEELWVRGPLADYALAPAPGDPELRLGTGWRGPYLRLPVGAATLRDGFGNPFQLLDADGVPMAAPTDTGEPVAIVRTLSADALVGGLNSYDIDLATAFGATAAAASSGVVAQALAPEYKQDFSVTVQVPGGSGGFQALAPASLAVNERVLVRIYGPIGANGIAGTIAQQEITSATVGPPQVSFTAIPIGPRTLRAYRVTGAAATPGSETDLTTVPQSSSQFTSTTEKSDPLRLYVTKEMDSAYTLILR